jgi:protein-disulfide isomerase
VLDVHPEDDKPSGRAVSSPSELPADFERLVSATPTQHADALRVTAREVQCGRFDAPVTLIAYTDYTSVYAHDTDAQLEAALSRFTAVKLVRRAYVGGARAGRSFTNAELVECARTFGAFVAAHRHVLREVAAGRNPTAGTLAGELGVDVAAFLHELASGRPRRRVARDVWTARSLGVDVAPTYIIDGEHYDGLWEEQALVDALEARLAEAAPDTLDRERRERRTQPAAPSARQGVSQAPRTEVREA